MKPIRFLLRNLWFYRKPYLAVAAGVIVSTAVLTGALIVGDSVQFSLRRYTDIFWSQGVTVKSVAGS